MVKNRYGMEGELYLTKINSKVDEIFIKILTFVQPPEAILKRLKEEHLEYYASQIRSRNVPNKCFLSDFSSTQILFHICNQDKDYWINHVIEALID